MIYAVPLLGLMTGCRTMMPMAVLCWFLYLGRLRVEHTWAVWAASVATVAVFTILAAGELVGDKLPQTPNRTALLPAIARLLFGGLVGSIVATALNQSLFAGEILGLVFALAGTFFGFHLRRWLVQRIKLPAFAVAVTEDLLVVGISIAALSMISV